MIQYFWGRRNPFSGYFYPTHVEGKLAPKLRHLRSGQVKRYLDATKGSGAYPILYVGLASGLRQGELISLPQAAVDIPGRQVVLKKRWVGLSSQAVELLKEEHDWHPGSPEAFLDAKTGRPHTLHRLYYLHRKVLSEVRLPVTGFRQLQLSARGMGL